MQNLWEFLRTLQFLGLMAFYAPMTAGTLFLRLIATLTLASLNQAFLIWLMDHTLGLLFNWEPNSVMDNYYMIDKPES